MGKELYTVEELAALFVMSENHIRNMVYAGKIPSVKVLGSIRFRAEDVEKMIRPREVKNEAKD